jgi:hypothetical protein
MGTRSPTNSRRCPDAPACYRWQRWLIALLLVGPRLVDGLVDAYANWLWFGEEDDRCTVPVLDAALSTKNFLSRWDLHLQTVWRAIEPALSPG